MPGSTTRPLDHLILNGQDDAPALFLRDNILTFKDLRKRIAALSGWLKHCVPQEGARIASWATKGELTCLLPLAAARAGLVHVPINPLLKRAQVAHILADSGARLLIGAPARIATLETGDIPEDCQPLNESDALTQAAALGQELPPSTANPDELAAILYTSGSTGRPKGVMLSHTNMWLGAVSVATYLGIKADDRTLAVLPLSFDYGQNQLLSSWYAGASVVPLDYLAATDVMKAIERYDITTLAAVPPLWVQLAELDWPQATSAKLRRLTNSGGALTPDLVSRLRTIFPQARLFAMYGLTEAFRSTFLDPALIDTHPSSMGKAIPFAEILVIGDDGQITADNEEGELVHCGPLVAQGYWQDAERTSERFKPAPEQSQYGGISVWSGDRVRRDADGLLYFVGRRDAMIKSSGNRISPQEIEEAAVASGVVAEAVALGIPDQRLGHAVHLVVRALPGASDAEAVLPHSLMQQLPNFMQPKAIHWRETMPIGPNGKLDRQGLAEEYRNASVSEPAQTVEAIVPPDAANGDLRSEMAALLGAKVIKDTDTFIGLGGDSLNYIRASLLLESSIGGIPDGWEHLPFIRLEELARASANSEDGGIRRGRQLDVLESSAVLRAIAIIMVVLTHDVSSFFSGATNVLMLVVGMNFARFQLPRLEMGGTAQILRTTLFKVVVPYFAVLILYSIVIRQIFWPQFLLYSNFTHGLIFNGERRFTLYWFLEVYLNFIIALSLLFLVPQVRAFVRNRPKTTAIGGFIAAVVAALVAQPYSNAGIFHDYTAMSAAPLFMFGWLIEKLKTPLEKLGLLLAGALLTLYLFHGNNINEILFMAVAVPILIFVRKLTVGSLLALLLSAIAGASFYIYILHGLVLKAALVGLAHGSNALPVWSMPLVVVTSLVTGLMVSLAPEILAKVRIRRQGKQAQSSATPA